MRTESHDREIPRIVKEYEKDLLGFLRDIVRIPSTSANEQAVAERILMEMEHLDFDDAWIDDVGNVIGLIGSRDASKNLLWDGHIDTVGISASEHWSHPPLSGEVSEGFLWGRGAADNKNATAVQVYGAFLYKKIYSTDLPLGIYVIGSTMEEDCDGLALEYALTHSIKTPISGVVIGEATRCRIYRGHRGRVELCIETSGKSAHASAPERGDNAVYKMADIIKDIEHLNTRLIEDSFLGKGSVAVTKIECDTNSLNCVPHSCRIYLDRRLTRGEDSLLYLSQLEELPSVQKTKASIQTLTYKAKAWTGKEVTSEKYFPTWTLEEKHPLVQVAATTYRSLFSSQPVIDKWHFSTNGIASMGRLGIPTIGFGPGNEAFAHITDERIPVDELLTATAFYTALPYHANAGL